jgi:glutamyl-tRNA synthetase
VGGARTALFNWLFARKSGGTFILRIEDTDAEKSSREMVEAITNALGWLGLKWDEGPYFQSERVGRHREIAEGLLAADLAYRCFCSREKIEAERREALNRGLTYVYSKDCREMPREEVERRLVAGEPHVIRLKVGLGRTVFHDRIYGEVAADNGTIGDFILLRQDRSPTYHLAVVVDDVDMGVTHVIRGEDHRLNTLKHIQIYKALGRPLPEFAHLPLILGSDKRRLSKRHGAMSVGAYREEGILPEALFNFLALLGWSPGDDRELMNRNELIEAFSLERVIKKSAIFDPSKLEWMNGEYISRSSPARLAELVTPLLKADGLYDPAFEGDRRSWYMRALAMLSERAHRLSDFITYGRAFFTEDFDFDPEAVERRWKSGSTVDYLVRTREALSTLGDFTSEGIEAAIRGLALELEVSAAKLIHPVRVAITGKAVGPGLFEIIELFGRDETKRRIDRAVAYIRSIEK